LAAVCGQAAAPADLDHGGLQGGRTTALRDAVVGTPKEELDTYKLTTEILGDRLYVNWMLSGDIRACAAAVSEFAMAEGWRNGYLQLESGAGMRSPPERDG